MSLIKREHSRVPSTWDPFGDFEDMFNRFSRLMPNWSQQSWPQKSEEGSMSVFDWAPSVNISESKKAYKIKAELPYVKKEDVDVTIENGVLCIKGERRQESEDRDEDEKYHRVETHYGSFMRRFTLPDDANADDISAKFKDGILTLKIARDPQHKTSERKIEVG